MKKKIFNFAVLSVFVYIVLTILLKEDNNKKLLSNDFSFTVAKVVSSDFSGKIRGVKFCYYVDSICYEGIGSTPVPEKYIGKYFILKYSNRKKNVSKINLNEEILDSLRIVNSGFNLKKSTYNSKTGKYEIIDYKNR